MLNRTIVLEIMVRQGGGGQLKSKDNDGWAYLLENGSYMDAACGYLDDDDGGGGGEDGDVDDDFGYGGDRVDGSSAYHVLPVLIDPLDVLQSHIFGHSMVVAAAAAVTVDSGSAVIETAIAVDSVAVAAVDH